MVAAIVKIGIQTWGSEGDLRPFFALSAGLSAAGHAVSLSYADVSFTITSQLVELAAAHAVTSIPPANDVAEFRRLSRLLLTEPKPPHVQIATVLDHLLYPMEQQLVQDAEVLCRDNDVIVGHFLSYPLAALAQKYDRPRIAVFTAPAYPSAYYVAAGVPDLGALGNRFTWWVARRVIEKMFGGPARKLYRDLGLPPVRSFIDQIWFSSLLNLVAVSPALFPRPKDWPQHHHVCGQLSLAEEPRGWQMPAPLQAFLDAGAPPVYMTFGSMLVGEEHLATLLQILIEAARSAGCRAIIQADWSRAPDVVEDADIYRLDRAPHAALFPRCAAVVHHGGAGTSHAATLAARPSVVVAHATDQLFWAATLRRLGLAGAPLQRRTLTVKRLARAMREVLDSSEMKKSATRVGAAMQPEDGVRAAVAHISASCCS